MAQLKGTIVADPIMPPTDIDRFPTHLPKYGKGGYRRVANLDERDAIPTERQEEGMLVWVISETTLYQLRSDEWIEFKISAGGDDSGGGQGGGQGDQPHIPTTVAELSDAADYLKVSDYETAEASQADIIQGLEDRISDLEEGSGSGGGSSEESLTYQFASVSDIPVDYPGNFVYIDERKTFYVKENGEWRQIETKANIESRGGIPIYTEAQVAQMEEEPEDYISIRDADELQEIPENDTRNYVDILFSAIRSLQSEVAKLRNSMKYGLYSYTGTDTAMSRVMDSYSEIPDEEPLWATEESDLSPIDGAGTELGNRHFLVPQENVLVLSEDALRISDATWNDPLGALGDVEDPKLYFYFTTSSLGLTINFGPSLSLDLSSLDVPHSSRYNILVVVSRKVQEAGDNFIWVSVSNYATAVTTNEGYWDPTINKLRTNKTSLPEAPSVEEILFHNLDLYKFNIYSKYQDFSNTVLPSGPSDEDYKYRVAHITIRSVLNYPELESIKDQLPKNELIYNEDNGFLYIKLGNGKVKRISGGGSGSEDDETTPSGMEKQQIIEWLAANGIIVSDEGGDLVLGPVADITFVHQGTGKKFKFETDAEGNLHATELSGKTYEDIFNNLSFDPDTAPKDIRGFVGTLGDLEMTRKGINPGKDKDHGLYSDRVKIGAIYAPKSTLTVHGCSHAYIELENTSDQDFLLDGCYLHYATGTSGKDGETADIQTYHLALEGYIPAGGTYLIRGKQYTSPDQANCFINVATYDKEWYIGNGELIDLAPGATNTYLLTYGLPDLSWTTVMWGTNTDTDTLSKAPWIFDPHYIDSVSIKEPVYNGESASNSTWTPWKKKHNDGKPDAINASAYFALKNFDCIYKNTFELEPAKQGYQSCGTIDSSRLRGVTATDYQYVHLDKDVIEFPKSEETYPVSKYTPKASFEHKNVCTDKSKLDMTRPNMVTCSFGINIHTTRCFNWISAGEFDEYVWLRRKGQEEWESRFESYKSGTESDDPGTMEKVEFPEALRAAAYNRLHGTFPADGTHYTAHKCIVKVVSTSPEEDPVEYEYIVGRADKNKNPDPAHCGNIQRFTLYPNTWTPRIFQTTDQQGFHWIEYQAWAAASKEVNKIINDELENGEHIIPILINTGDMTQNGTRINEWFDYYNGGYCLFDHLEQMNIVGNNDLVGTDPELLGTGDDNGKSNGHYFHVFYCYEVDPEINPVIPSTDGTQIKYIPSFYYFENESSSGVDSYRFVFLNTEITTINCRDWYKRTSGFGPINVYTGWPICDDPAAEYDSGFTTIYTMIYRILDQARTNGQHIIAACHEMPFTVVTKANLADSSSDKDRSMNGKSLVGCHCNREGKELEKSIYWLSRLLENFEVKLMLGGHKHTYACTNPLREFYFYDGGTKNSLADGPMTMEETLEHDDQVSWTVSLGYESGDTDKVYTMDSASETRVTFNTTKIPIMIVPNEEPEGTIISSNTIWPYYGIHSSSFFSGVTYSMCQATGYKLKSNKELPSDQQKFSLVIPLTSHGQAGDSPDPNQLRPMFVEVVLNRENYSVFLARIENILTSDKGNFSQDNIVTAASRLMYLISEADGNKSKLFGHWIDNKDSLVEL